MTTGAAIAGKYRLLRPLGKGSMGEVWAALHVGLGREVALKLIYEGSPELAARLKREAQACGRLEHPNIVRVYDFGETDGGDPFLVMEMLAGETLADRLARTPRLPPNEAVSVALDVARALRAAHEASVIHRDLKPANVFLCKKPDGETVKVLDFGVSKLLSVDDMSVTTTGALVGSPAYMSPEQARALREIDPRADIWSVGVLLFEMITGTRPFPSPTVVGVVADILAGPIPTIASVMQGIDPRIDQAVRRCLTRDLDQRMPSAAALIDALSPVLATPRPPATPAFEPPRPAPRADSDADLTPVESMEVVLDPNDPDEARTIALPSRLVPKVSEPVTESDPEVETAIMQGRAVLAMRAQARMPPAPPPTPHQGPTIAHRLPPPPPPSAPEVAPRARQDSEDMPTAVQGSGRAPEQAVVPTRVIAHPFATRAEPAVARAPQFGPPPAMPSAPAAVTSPWDVLPSRQHTATTQPLADPAATRITLPPGWEASRSDARRVLWITAIAGLVVGLVVFVGLSLLR